MSTPVTGTSAIKLALAAKRLRDDAADSTLLLSEPIAVVGIGCRLPGGANSPEQYWQLLMNGVDAIREVPSNRWNAAEWYDPDPYATGRMNTRWGSFLDGVDEFDPVFFGIAPREAALMDPQQRLLLEVTWESLWDAGIAPHTLAGSTTGVFMANYIIDYSRLLMADVDQIGPHSLSGGSPSIASGRLSYLLDLRGPSLTIDTACSSSLSIIHLACQSLRTGDCSLALAGGVTLHLTPEHFVSLAKLGMLSPDGRCHTFDAAANGFVPGEGCGVVALKRLSDAIADGDRIHAVVRGTAVMQDGRSTVLTAPNGPAQEEVVRAALANARVAPDQITYVETHGTGTALGDPIEVEALTAALPGATPCVLGAVKTNFGHLEAASGITGFIKAVLALEHEQIPANLHFSSLNPHISLDGTRFVIPSTARPWPRGAQGRFAGVSAFGFGGTNAHVILEEAPAIPTVTAEAAPVVVLPISARRPEALTTLARAYQEVLRSGVAIGDVCRTAAARRSHYEERIAVTGATAADLVAGLDDAIHHRLRAGVSRGRAEGHGVVFICSGQGSQWAQMGRGLRQYPAFRTAIDACDAAVRRHGGWSLIERLDADEASSTLDHTEYAQPAIVAIEIAIARLWESWGVVPDAVIGHSVGEIAAAHLAGAIALDEAMRIAVLRGRLMEAATGTGRMAAVYLPVATVREDIASYGDRVSVAAVNAPGSTVISGDSDAISAIVAAWTARGVQTRALPVDYAFHSAQMEPFRIALTRELGQVTAQHTTIPMISTVTGQTVTGVDLTAEYWGRNIRQPVLFGNAVQQALAMSYETFVEVGPHPVLMASVRECYAPEASGTTVVASLRKQQDPQTTLFASLCELYTRGATVQWTAVYPKRTTTVTLPAYPYQRERYWIPKRATGTTRRSAVTSVDGQAGPLLGARVRSPLVTGIAYDVAISRETMPYLFDHRIAQTVILPMTAFLEIVVEAVIATFGRHTVELHDVVVQAPLPLPDEGVRHVQVILEDGQFRVFSRDGDEWTVHAHGHYATTSGTPDQASPRPSASTSHTVDVREHYDRAAAHGAMFGPEFQTVATLSASDDVATALSRLSVEEAANAGTYWIHPAVLDGCLQTVLAVADNDESTWVPAAIDRFVVYGRAGAEVHSTLRLREAKSSSETQENDSGARDILTTDVWVEDSAGVTVATITGLRFKRLRDEVTDTTARLRYRVTWTPRARQSASRRQSQREGSWLIVESSVGVGEALHRALEHRGASCTTVPADAITTTSVAGYRGVVYLANSSSVSDTVDAHLERDCTTVLSLVQQFARQSDDPAPLWLVTRDAEAVRPDDQCTGFASAPLLGLARTIAREHPELACTTVDLDATGRIDALVDELLHPDTEDRIALRGDERYVARLEPQGAHTPVGTPRRLVIPTRGTLDNLAFAPLDPVAPGAGAAEVHVEAAALNFRDVLNALDMYPGEAGPLGLEFAGRITRVGPDVTQWHVGDRVMGITWGTFASSIVVPTTLLTSIPDALDVEAAATLPNAFVTAHHCLMRTAKLRAGERVLIHAGAGGVGMAAVQLALDVGAEVFSTAGNEEKRAYLRSLGVQHVMDSRSLDFSREILELTNSRGVDVVLNSLSGDFVDASFAATAPGGRFVEIGKIGIWTQAQVEALGKQIAYSVIDLGTVIDNAPEVIGEQLDQIRQLVETHHIRPLPYRAFAFDDAPAAFRYMAQARHLGRVVLRFPDVTTVRTDATYVITGGLGGMGLVLARSLAEQGATHLVLLGRSAPSPDARDTIETLRASGTTVDVRAVDITRRADLDAVLSDIARTMPPIRGVVHAAGVIDDGMLVQQSWERFAHVLAPKVQGTWNLHELTQPLALDFFIVCGSVASLFGSAGQGAYSAGNAFLDALAAYRHAHALPALSISWGPWADVGMAARTTQGGRALALDALRPLPPETGAVCFTRALTLSDTHVAIVDARWANWTGYVPSLLANIVRTASTDAATSSAALPTTTLKDELARAPEATRRGVLIGFVRQEARRVLGLSESHAIDERQPLLKIGLDSLMAVELRNRVAASLGRTLPATLLFDYPSLGAIADFVLGASDARDRTQPDGREAVRDHMALQDIAAMSDEEAEQMLARELENF